VYGLSPEARRLATVAVASLHRMRAFLRLLSSCASPVATVEVPRIIDLDHKSDLEVAERWLSLKSLVAPVSQPHVLAGAASQQRHGDPSTTDCQPAVARWTVTRTGEAMSWRAGCQRPS